jgi:hypothetical protein
MAGSMGKRKLLTLVGAGKQKYRQEGARVLKSLSRAHLFSLNFPPLVPTF